MTYHTGEAWSIAIGLLVGSFFFTNPYFWVTLFVGGLGLIGLLIYAHLERGAEI